MACDIFGIWFTVNFAISEKQFPSQKTLMEDFVSVGLLSSSPFSQYREIERWKNYISAKNTTALSHPMEQGITFTFMSYCHDELLGGSLNAELQITELFTTLTLKNVAYTVSLIWGKLCNMLLLTIERRVLE
jgi:hypothetical protein